MIYKIKPWILNWICQGCGWQNPEAYGYCNGCGKAKP